MKEGNLMLLRQKKIAKINNIIIQEGLKDNLKEISKE